MRSAAMAYEQSASGRVIAPQIVDLAGRVFRRIARAVKAVLVEFARIPQYQAEAERLREGLLRQGRRRA